MLDRILLLAHKDLRLLWRDRGALFSVLLFPLLFAGFFGLMFSGGGSGGSVWRWPTKIPVPPARPS